MSPNFHCIPRPSAFVADRRATVLSLVSYFKAEVNGVEFFGENSLLLKDVACQICLKSLSNRSFLSHCI